MTKTKAEHGPDLCDDEDCQICCPHDEYDHGICLDCGLDRTEDLAADAYDRAKAGRDDKYS